MTLFTSKLGKLIALAALVLAPSLASAQFTTATALLVDSAGTPYQNCSFNGNFIGESSQPGPYLLSGSVFQTSFSGARCDSSGNLSFTVADNNQILPSPSQWQINFCDQTGKFCGSATLTITGATQNISSALTAVAPLLPNPGPSPGLNSNNHFTGNNSFTTAGIFSSTQQNDFLTSVINGCNPVTEIGPGQIGFMTDGFNSCTAIPNTSTVVQANAVTGIVTNASGATTAGVAVFGVAHGKSNNSRNWGSNFAAGMSSNTFTGGTLYGTELDLNVDNTTTVANGILINGNWTAQPTSSFAILINQPQVGVGGTGPYFWPYGMRFLAGATQAPNANGGALYFGPVGTASTNLQSQGIAFDAKDTVSGDNVATLAEFPNGNLVLQLTKSGAGFVTPAITSMGLSDFSAAGQWKSPITTGFTSLANGEFGYDSTLPAWHFWQGGVDQVDTITTIQNCGTTTTCSHTVLGGAKMVIGSVALTSGTPSTATVTGFTPAFTSSTSYFCTVSNATTAADGVKVVNASASSITITGPNTVTDVINYHCVGN